MSHKLQPSTPKSHGLNTVALDPSATTDVKPTTPTTPSTPTPARHSTCEIMRSRGYDPTGERAEQCGATAAIVCEFCGPMCSHCAEEALCFHDEHKIVEDIAPQSTADRAAGPAEPKPLYQVIYLELSCPNCGAIRLALPRQLEPQTRGPMGCPICAAEAPAKYLAHGLTQRELPFYERFDPEPLTSSNRIPWDPMPPKNADHDE